MSVGLLAQQEVELGSGRTGVLGPDTADLAECLAPWCFQGSAVPPYIHPHGSMLATICVSCEVHCVKALQLVTMMARMLTASGQISCVSLSLFANGQVGLIYHCPEIIS